MSVFKKLCFNCGNKVDFLKEGLCENCYKEQFPPIKEIKQLNLKSCNVCSRISYNNHFYSVDEFEDMLDDILRKKVVLNEGYKLNSVHANDLEIKGTKVSFDVSVDCDLE